MTLRSHLQSGATTVARCWAVTRSDGLTLGFTDHDRELAFDGRTFRPDTGLSAKAVVQGTGLAVDNSEAAGALTSDAITDADIEAGRYDGAEVRLWHVNWQDVGERELRFRGTLGEIRREDGAFHAELRGLTEPLNRPAGRLFQKDCTAVLGDAACGVNLALPAYSGAAPAGANDGRSFALPGLAAFAEGFFDKGRLRVLSGAAQGLVGVVRADALSADLRRIDLWSPLRAPVAPADSVRLEAGCDKRPDTCRVKFSNLLNFRGFPFIPGEDWLLSHPTRSSRNDGGRLG